MSVARVYVKEHRTLKGIVLAMCDEGLIGSVLRDGEIVIDLDTYRTFYTGELVDMSEAVSRLRRLLESRSLLSVNAVGENSIEVLRRAGVRVVIPTRFRIPHVQLFTPATPHTTL
ncbi:DUF424 family protein [Candidatus Micrarchaeota archaeon]|nr:DUF424 family protein [Candidatus Micrarchaeota archaeon]